MRCRADAEARALYLYFHAIRPGGIKDTIPGVLCELGLSESNQLSTLTIFDLDEADEVFPWTGRLQFVSLEPLAAFDGRAIHLDFSDDAVRTIQWDCNVDLDDSGQIVGVEVLFAEDIIPPRIEADAGNR
jgi:uncharacterized protein YuzE